MSDAQQEGNLTDGDIPFEPKKAEDAKEKETAPEEPAKKPRRKWFWAVLFILLLILAFFLVRNYRKNEAAEKAKAAVKPQGASITTGQSKTGDINIYVDALGTVTPVNTA